MQVISIALTRTVQEEGFCKFITGDPTNPHCSSFGGSMRRMCPGNECFPDLDEREYKVYFTGIPRELHDPDVPIEMLLGLVSADSADRDLWVGILKGRANFFCPCCDVHRRQ